MTEKPIPPEGMRLLDDDEKQSYFKTPIPELMSWSNGGWDSGVSEHIWYGNEESLHYATKLTRAELREARGIPEQQPERTGDAHAQTIQPSGLDAAASESNPPVIGGIPRQPVSDTPKTQWVSCPICGESQMPKELDPGDENEGGYIRCCNLNCASNGGDNAEAFIAKMTTSEHAPMAYETFVLLRQAVEAQCVATAKANEQLAAIRRERATYRAEEAKENAAPRCECGFQCEGECPYCAAAELRRENAELREQSLVLFIRCMRHRSTPQQNDNEITKAECGGCISEERDEATARAEAAEETNTKLREAFGVSLPWPLRDVLTKLTEATEHLLNDHGCDTDGHEQFRGAVNQAMEFMPKIDAALAQPEPKGDL